MKIKPEGLPQSVIGRLQELADRYPHAEIELYPDTIDLTDQDLADIEGIIQLDAGEYEDFDQVIAEARAIVASKRKAITVHDALQAWQDGDIPEAKALSLTGCGNVINMYKAALSSDVEIKIPMTPEQAEAVAALDWSSDRT